jgi:hypothetical protein
MADSSFELLHPLGVSITKALSQDALVRALPDVGATRRDMGTGWTWYRLPSFQDEGTHVTMALGFEVGALKQIILSDSNPEFGSNWNEWTEAKERRRAESIRTWLGRQGIVSGDHKWGSVWAGFDPKGGSGCAAVRFA